LVVDDVEGPDAGKGEVFERFGSRRCGIDEDDAGFREGFLAVGSP